MGNPILSKPLYRSGLSFQQVLCALTSLILAWFSARFRLFRISLAL